MLPPSEPKVPIRNYLGSLRRDIKLIGTQEIISDWHSKRFKSFGDASRKIGVSESFYRHIVRGKVGLPVWMLRKLSEIDGRLSDAIYEKVQYFSSRSKLDRVPKHMNPSLAYYVGYLHGDGHVDMNGKRLTFTDASAGQLDLINELNRGIFGFYGDRYERRSESGNPVNVLDVRRVTVNSFFSDVLGVRRGKRTTNSVPVEIMKEKELVRWYLCGLFDAEGSMPINPVERKDVYIDISMRDSGLIKSVKTLLENHFGVVSYGPYEREHVSKISKNVSLETEIKIRRHSEVRKFLENIGTIHPNKVKRSKLIIRLLGP